MTSHVAPSNWPLFRLLLEGWGARHLPCQQQLLTFRGGLPIWHGSPCLHATSSHAGLEHVSLPKVQLSQLGSWR